MDSVDPLRFVLAFAFVLGLIGLLALGLKRYARAQKIFGVQGSSGRVAVVETRYLDPKRRLVLVRRDETEHLLLLSDKGDQVIESSIKKAAINFCF